MGSSRQQRVTKKRIHCKNNNSNARSVAFVLRVFLLTVLVPSLPSLSRRPGSPFAPSAAAAAVDVDDGRRSQQQSESECYATCNGLRIGSDDWIIPPYDVLSISTCLQRPVSDGGQGDDGQDAMRTVYDNVAGLLQAGAPISDVVEEAVVAGLNAALPGATVPNSEGLYYCISDADAKTEGFYWVLNCDVMTGGVSQNGALCANLTDVEARVGNVGYVVDDSLLGTDGKHFHRFVFNATHALESNFQPISGATGFSCSSRPWFESGKCQDPLKVTCPTGFVGSEGLGAFQTYGDVDVAVVSQDVTTWQLCACLDDLDCAATAGGASHPPPSFAGHALLVLFLPMAFGLLGVDLL